MVFLMLNKEPERGEILNQETHEGGERMKLMGQGMWGIHQGFARAYFMLLMSHIPSEKKRKTLFLGRASCKDLCQIICIFP